MLNLPAGSKARVIIRLCPTLAQQVAVVNVLLTADGWVKAWGREGGGESGWERERDWEGGWCEAERDKFGRGKEDKYILCNSANAPLVRIRPKAETNGGGWGTLPGSSQLRPER